MHQLTDEQLAIITTWANKTPDVQVVFLSGDRARGTAVPTAMWSWRSPLSGRTHSYGSPPSSSAVVPGGQSLSQPLGVPVKLERTRSEATPADYVELWRRA
jgi:hypothetical protein